MDRLIREITDIRVRYADTDQMRIVYYGKFFEYFEQGRSDLLRSIGLSYAQIEEMGYLLPVIEAHASYRRSARYDELLHVATHLRELPVVRVRLDYLVTRDGEEEPIVEGYTIHSFVSGETGKPIRAPVRFLEAVEQGMKKG